MKKVVLIIIAILICIVVTTGCKESSGSISPQVSESQKAEPQISEAQPVESMKEDISTAEGSLVYLDPETDMAIVVGSTNWAYTKELYPGEVFFFPKDKQDGITGFAISSQIKDDKTDIEEMWSLVKNNLKKGMQDLVTEQEDDIEIGEYTGKRYHFNGIGNAQEVDGDYFFWLTEERLYICSFMSKIEEYESNLEIVVNALKTFEVPNK